MRCLSRGYRTKGGGELGTTQSLHEKCERGRGEKKHGKIPEFVYKLLIEYTVNYICEKLSLVFAKLLHKGFE